ncbi:phosphopantothenoylcysteine decarboxylase [Hetaerina americana]|uniref:phosphopantothenoylcysteine decarboxylase n=1 Tax=Hetaerina americana TaxID=62018 RepID=UPI003A7F31EA
MASHGANVLIGVTGSVATIKLPVLVNSLLGENEAVRVKVITTERAKHFFDEDQLFPGKKFTRGQSSASSNDEISNSCDSAASSEKEKQAKKDMGEEKPSDCDVLEVLSDDSEWSRWKKIGDPVLHIDLCKWADIFVIAPLDANTLGKLANGLCDNLLTCTFRAWDVGKPLVFCPAMNTKMWAHPMTAEHISKLVSWGHTLVPPISKKLACGDEGTGAMAEVTTIVDLILHILKHNN